MNLTDIRDPIADLCDKLGVELNDVNRIDFDCSRQAVTVKVFKRDEQGSFYVDGDEAASDMLRFRLRIEPGQIMAERAT